MKASPLTTAAALLAGLATGLAVETPVQPQIDSVGLFKNGVAVVRASFTVPGPGTYRWDAVPQTIHGTFAVDSDAVLSTTATHRIVEEELKSAPTGMQDALAGKNVTVTLQSAGVGGSGPANLRGGRVWAVPAVPSNNPFSTQYPTADPYGRYYGWNGPALASHPARMDDFLILETEQGREYINRQCILSVAAEGPFGTVKQQVEKPVLLFEVTTGSGQVRLTYLARGMAWLPAYAVDTSDPATLTIRQSAVVRNELMDLGDTALELISGYPNIRFSHVDSPLNPDTPLTTFFQQLNSQGNAAPATMSQMVSFNSVAPAANPLPQNPEVGSAGTDLHYQPAGKHPLRRGDSLALEIATGKSPYTRIAEWLVPDFRSPDGRRDDRRADRAVPDPEDQPWDALRFTNPFKFPMTTAPASIMEAGKFRGQSLSQWVNPGQPGTLRVTQALSIRAQASETEEDNARAKPKPEDIAWFRGSRYLRLTIKGTLQLHNYRATAVPMEIRCRFSGELIDADAAPTTTLLNESTGINPRTELAWSLPLKPGEAKTLHYSYHLWTTY